MDIFMWVEFTGLKRQSGDAILTTSGRHYVDGAERINLNDGANLAINRDGLADGGFRGIHAVFTGWIADKKGRLSEVER